MYRVIALGNAGGNIVHSLLTMGDFPDIEFIFCDTDETDLLRHGRQTDRHVLIKDLPQFRKEILDKNSLMDVLVTGLGGGCSNKFSTDFVYDTFADFTYCFATLPAAFEGTEKRKRAVGLFNWINEYTSITVLQDNDKLPNNLQVSDMDSCLASLLELLINPARKGLSNELEDMPFGVWGTQKQVMMVQRAKYCNYAPLADFHDAGTITLHVQKETVQ